jgi:hypothetical protein
MFLLKNRIEYLECASCASVSGDDKAECQAMEKLARVARYRSPPLTGLRKVMPQDTYLVRGFEYTHEDNREKKPSSESLVILSTYFIVYPCSTVE